MDVYLVLHQLFTGKILGIYTKPKNLNNTFQLVFLNEVLSFKNDIRADLVHNLYGLGDIAVRTQ